VIMGGEVTIGAIPAQASLVVRSEYQIRLRFAVAKRHLVNQGLVPVPSERKPIKPSRYGVEVMSRRRL